MSELTDALDYVNGVYGSVNGISVPPITENMTVAEYLAIMESLQMQALKLVTDAIEATQAASQYADVSVQLSLLFGLREQLVGLYGDITAFFVGTADNLTLNQAWEQQTANPPPDDGIPPETLPADDAIVLYGDTPMLLRASDPSVPIGAAYTGPPSGLIVTSPEISIASNQNWSIGTVTGTGVGEALQIIKDGAVSGLKGMLGEVISNSGNQYAGYSVQAWEAYDLGVMISGKAYKSIDFITSGLEVLAGNKPLSEWNEEHNAFMRQTENEFDTLAKSTIVSKIPVVGWVLSPVVDAYMKMSYKLQNTNSFTISVTSDSTIAGGAKGGVFLGGAQNDYILVGSGDALAAGGNGNDTFTPGIGKQYLLGDSGIDTAVYTTAHTSHALIKASSGYTVSGLQGTQTLVDVERLKFSDTNLALDLNGNAGITAKILGAVFGVSSVANKEYVGIGLNLLDGGMSYEHLMQLAINARLGANAANEEVVELLYTNVVGTPPGVADLAYYKDMLDQGVFTQASLGVIAAETSLNQGNVDLVGLSSTGIEFI